MTHKGTVTLATERLILRRFAVEDAEAMFRNSFSDPKVPIYMTWNTYESIDAARNYIVSVTDGYNSLSAYHWVIVVKELGEPIGSIGVTRYNNETQCVAIGYSIGSKWWRQGYTSEALKRLVCFFFDEVGTNRIEAQHDTRNPNSGKVMIKAGLQFEGVLRQSEHNNQGVCDSAHYAILAEDYFRRKSPHIGKSTTAATTVNDTNTAKSVGSGSLDVFATPMMIALMERAACECIAECGLIADGQTSVGTAINAMHTASSPRGAAITATATITSVDGRKVEFDVAASDENGEIGRGTHSRFIVDAERFMTKARA